MGGVGWQRRRPEPDASIAKIGLLFINLIKIWLNLIKSQSLMSFTLCLEFGKLSASLTRQGQGQSGGARASLGCQSKSGVPGPKGASLVSSGRE